MFRSCEGRNMDEDDLKLCTICNEGFLYGERHPKCFDKKLEEVELMTAHELTSIKIESKQLKKEVIIARNLFEGLEGATAIWLPENVDPEHMGEAIALHNFRNKYLEFLELTKDRIAR